MVAIRPETFEAEIHRLTQPINNQYPRPWMTDLKDPQSASVFIVGKNQASEYSVERLEHKRHIDALFNRSGESCRGLYDEMRKGKPSQTRKHIDHFRSILAEHGITDVLETNVNCYSTRMSRDLKDAQHVGGEEAGREIFKALLTHIKPKIIIVHGARTRKELGQILGTTLPPLPGRDSIPVAAHIHGMQVFPIPCLAAPEFHKWKKWSDPYLCKVAAIIAGESLRVS